MADTIDRKLDMSLDDLVKKERTQHKQGGPGPQRHHAQHRQQNGAGPMASWPWRDGPGRGRGGGHPGRGAGQQQGGPWPHSQQHQPQQQQYAGFTGQPQYQGNRSSVFARLSGVPSPHPQPQQQQQQEYYQQQQYGPPGGRQQWQQQQPPQPQRQQQQQQPPPKIERPKVALHLDQATGMVQMTHEGYVIIQVSPAGDVILDSGGNHSAARRAAFNIVLSHFNMAVREAPAAAATATADGMQQQQQQPWNVAEGHRLTRFSDGMKMPARGPLTANRAMVLVQAYGGGNKKATAAQEASMRAAVQAGILPANAAAAAGPAGEAGAGDEDAEAARIRRLKAQGRYVPY